MLDTTMSDATMSIDVATDFSAYPAGRDQKDGPNNGTRFREEVLMPRLQRAISEGSKVTVNFDGVRSFGSSFLEEAFGGLVRRGLTAMEVKNHLALHLDGPGHDRYLHAIYSHIERARPQV